MTRLKLEPIDRLEFEIRVLNLGRWQLRYEHEAREHARTRERLKQAEAALTLALRSRPLANHQ